VSANNVLPVPAAIGGGALIERGWIGMEGAIYVDAALCDHGTASDSRCGLLWIFDICPARDVGARRKMEPVPVRALPDHPLGSPQAFSHLALISTARTLDAVRQSGDARAPLCGEVAPAIH
jgi:hypothetical protein